MNKPVSISARFLLAMVSTVVLFAFSSAAFADSSDRWWDDGWPYRIPVSVSGVGIVSVSVDFTAAFSELGLNEPLLDVRSIRVVPYAGVSPGEPVPHRETYSTMLEDADAPQIGWHSSGVYWSVNDGEAQGDSTRFSQGTGSLKAFVENLPEDEGGYGYPGVELRLAEGHPLSDWTGFELLVYDVWPQVNQSAKDQAPDLYYFKLYNTSGCDSSNITQGGPPLALDRWNRASVPLKPFHTCLEPAFDNITRIEFHTRDNSTVNGNSGLWDDGDELTLWFDNVRLVDQDGGGEIKWNADGTVSKYYVYFDVFDHEGHPAPVEASLGNATVAGVAGAPEAGGYYHRIEGAATAGLTVWAAPPVEKVFRTNAAPAVSAPLTIQAAKNEFEPFQIVVRSDTDQRLAVHIGDFTKGGDIIPASRIRLHRQDYVWISRLSDHFGRAGYWPDPLYPVELGDKVDFQSGENQPLWFTVRVPEDAVAGIYRAEVAVGAARIPVSLEVWDFSLPKEIHLQGEWGFGWSQVVAEYKGTNGGVHECYWDLVDAIYEDFADHRLVPKGVGWPAGLNYPGGVEYDCDTGVLDPDSWGDWSFHTIARKYLDGDQLENQSGFPCFLIKGPSSNWPPASRPSSFCDQSRGTDPPGEGAYNDRWFSYWSAVGDYAKQTSDYAKKGYYHIVNEPQTFDDYDIVAYLARETKKAAPDVRILVSEQVEPYIYDNPLYPGAKIDIWMPTISNYQEERAHERQTNHGEEVWWYFLYGDRPPLPNPTVMDRVGLEARIVPWLAWMERVDGLLYYSITDWSPDPWEQPWSNDGNGDGFMLYPPKEGGWLATNPCDPRSNRLVPSNRWELLREGMEDYEYLRLLAEGDPVIGEDGVADRLARGFVSSRTLFSRVPTDLYETRALIARYLVPTTFQLECLGSISSAIASAELNATVEIPEGIYREDVEVTEFKILRLQGRWNCSHTSRGWDDTVIDGSLSIFDGRVTLDGLIIM